MAIVLIAVVLGLCAAAAVPVIRRLRLKAAEQALLDNPPARVSFQVKLPPDADGTNVKMTRAYERFLHALDAVDRDPAGQGDVLEIGLIGEGTVVGQAPKVRLVVRCAPELFDAVQRCLDEAYGSDSEIVEIDDEAHPLLAYHRQAAEDRRLSAQAALDEQEASAREPDAQDEAGGLQDAGEPGSSGGPAGP